ncbi:MAG: SDR family NAD(P)-dependent oxidoreductase [Gammaproteobacteria bacterium]|nr:SDR family NAD(P)-dependent oxidoreductase [Gammaproteobacteria bacterium]
MDRSLVVITGAAGALGRAVASHFLSRGCSVVLVDRDDTALKTAYANVDGDRTFVATDLTDTVATRDALSAVFADKGAADVLCNIAGGFTMGKPVDDADPSDWQRMIDMNVNTMLNACRAVVPGMRQAGVGKVINIAAASASSGKAMMGAYCASKDAVARLTESMAQELREQGINVNAVAPSIIDTPANRDAMPDADPARWVSPEKLSAVIGFLASDDASAIHGAVIPVVGLS